MSEPDVLTRIGLHTRNRLKRWRSARPLRAARLPLYARAPGISPQPSAAARSA